MYISFHLWRPKIVSSKQLKFHSAGVILPNGELIFSNILGKNSPKKMGKKLILFLEQTQLKCVKIL